MKRRIVRVTAGAVIVLAWLAAGVYAFWGGKDEDVVKPPAIDPQQMSQQIAKAQAAHEKAAESPAASALPGKPPPSMPKSKPPASLPEASKPSADGLFGQSRLTSGGAFQPRAGAFASTSDDAENASDEPSPYAATVPEVSIPIGGNAPAGAAMEPVPDENTEQVAGAEVATEPPAFERNPLRTGSVLAQPPAGELPEEDVPTPAPAPRSGVDVNAPPPPSRFSMSDDAAAPPPSRFQLPESGSDAAPRADLATSAPGYDTENLPPAPRGLSQQPQPLDEDPNAPLASPPSAYGQGGLRTPPPSRFAVGDAGVGAAAASPVEIASIASPRPGERAYEGTQAPSLVIEKFAPPEIQVGKPAKFEIHVRNAGQTAAQQVVVTDHVPAGTQFVSARPEPQQAADGSLVWQLGTLEAGEDTSITVELMPQEEGEIGSVAQVTFAAAASAKTVCTRPQLAIEHIAPAKVMVGESVTLQITISNPGTGVATGVVLQEDVPEGLAHSAGRELEYEVGTLRPGESRKLELVLEAAKAGVIQNKLVVRGDANLEASHTTTLEVIAPQLAVEMNGPKLRYLDRQATYTVVVANPGTAAARDVEIVAYLPKGMKFISTDREGQYDPQNHAVYWSLEELPPAQQGSAQLVAIPVEPGEQKLRVEGHAQQGLSTADEKVILVEAIPQLVFEIINEADPIEINAETVYEVRVLNEGSKSASNVRVTASLPPELRPVAAEGATRGAVQGQNVVFEPIASLAPQAEAVFKIQATGLRTGGYTVRVQVTSDDLQTPVTKEEHTRVYADR